MLKILAFSDLHTSQKAARKIVKLSEDADVVIGAGDFANQGKNVQATIGILARITKPTLIVPGNHESLTALKEATKQWSACQVLFGNTVTIFDIPFFGLGYETPKSNEKDWNCFLNEEDAADKLSSCPPGAVLITHAPPYGACDQQKNGRRDGSIAIRETILKKAPRLHICGHIHASWGQNDRIGPTPVHNIGPKGQFLFLR